MRTLLIAALSLVTTVVAYCQSERKVSSTIKDVTVFLKGAQVTRTTSLELKPGQSVIVLNGTSPKVQENSIQAEANQNVKIIGVSFRVNHLEDLKQSEAAEFVQKERARLSNLIKEEKTAIAVYDDEEAMLKANKIIGGQRGADVNELKSAVEYYRQRLMDIRAHRQELEAKIASYERDIAKINAQQSEMKVTKPQPEGEIIIKVESKSEAQVNLKVSYLVQEASWFPLYDIRAKDIQTPIAITYKASITQQSGEDWENVKVTVSSANPTSIGSRPNIKPWYLGFNNSVKPVAVGGQAAIHGAAAGAMATNNMVRGYVFDSGGKPMPGVNIVVKGTSNGTVTDVNGAYSMAISPNSKTLAASFIGYQIQEIDVNGQEEVNIMLNEDVAQLEEVVVVGYGAQTQRQMTGSYSTTARAPKVKQTIAATPVVRSTNLEFNIDTPYTIRSGGENQVVDMIEYELEAQYQYYCAPKLDTDAFLTARLTNWDEYNFMEGQASLFFEGKYIGKTVLDTRNTSDTLTLSLGRDRNVVVTREKVKEYSSNQFVGSNRKALFSYEISVRNKKAYPIDIRIEDQYPIPNTKDITVDEIEDSGAIKSEENGLLTWNLKVEPGKTSKIDLKYEIKYPRYHNIILE
ncbi:MAG TPA: mucoidy inhibitor MuiA family protein [Cyclobacteriaceae bacterium]|nr:mucoidy inhibitor MuiA family protein [Cyclobacteriaceae bacterium]